MNFITVPVEVVSNHILPLLGKNDWLRLRRVCKHTKTLADDHIRLYSSLSVEIDMLDPLSHSLANFMGLTGLVSSVKRFHIKNTNALWIQVQDFRVRDFATAYGGNITHLTLGSLELPIVSDHLLFLFKSLTSLQHLCISKLFDCSKTDDGDIFVPEAFQNLQSFKIETFFAAETTDSAFLKSANLLWSFHDKCTTKVDSVTHPFIECRRRGFGGRRSDPGTPFRSFCKLITDRAKDGKPNLKHIDLMGYEEDGMNSSTNAFYTLIKLCSEYNISVRNVDAALIEGICSPNISSAIVQPRRLIESTLISMKNLNPIVYPLELPLLERIWVEGTGVKGAFSFNSLLQYPRQRPLWTKLKELKFTFGPSFLIGMGSVRNGVKTREAIHYFFVDTKREAMETLSIGFDSDGLDYPANFKAPFPKPRDIVNSCVNLKNLTISNWPGTNKMISQLWEGLPLLEKVELAACENLGNVAFVGENTEDPVFLKLKRLQVLKLRNLEKMPKITDTLFTLVIRHLPLKQLHLTSHKEEGSNVIPESLDSDDSDWEDVDEDEPLDSYPSITLAGIQALLTGEFAQTIEVFSIWKDLKLKDVQERKLRKLEHQFRSANML